MKRAFVIVNPVAGEQRPMQAAADTRAHLEQAGWIVQVVPTEHPGHATELARECGRDQDLVVVVGGDGTLRETVVGLHGQDTPVGLVPVGKANVVARELGIPRRPRQAIRVLTSGRARSMDAGQVGESVFLAMVGIGYDGWALAAVGWMRSTRWGAFLYRHGGSTLIYILAGLPALLRLVPNRVEVRCDGKRLAHRYPSLIIANTETYALGWAMTPGARTDDGRLDHQANRRSAPWFVMVTLLAAILRRRVPRWVAEYGSGRTYQVRADQPFRWQVDGDPMPPTAELQIDILPAYARILVPAEPGGIS